MGYSTRRGIAGGLVGAAVADMWGCMTEVVPVWVYVHISGAARVHGGQGRGDEAMS